ncbi:MAG: efflux RND transporter permease subunit, partial [Deltaproteobacteria bacterium]
GLRRRVPPLRHGALWRRSERRFGRLLRGMLQRPKATLLAGSVLCAAGLSLTATIRWPANVETSGLAHLAVQTSPGSPPAALHSAVLQLEHYARRLPEAQAVWLHIKPDGYRAELYVALRRAAYAQRAAVAHRLLRYLRGIEGLQPSSLGGADLRFFVQGSDAALTESAAASLAAAMRRSATFAQVHEADAQHLPLLVLRPQRERLHDVGLSVQALVQSLQLHYGPNKVGEVTRHGRRLPIDMQLPLAQRHRARQLHQAPLWAANNLVPLQSLTEARLQRSPAMQLRRDRRRAVPLAAHLAPGMHLEQARAQLLALAAHLPASVALHWQTHSVQQPEGRQQLLLAGLLGLALAYMVLAAHLNAVGLPLLVLLALFSAAAGAAAALAMCRVPCTEMTLMGLLLVFGLVIQHSIVLLDCAQRLVMAGVAPKVAAEQAATLGLRRLVMTTCTILGAVLPTAVAIAPGGGEPQSMALAVLGGLLGSTLLSHLLVPAAFSLAYAGPKSACRPPAGAAVPWSTDAH